MQDCTAGLKSRGICVIIPTFNNAGTIVDVVSRTQRFCSDVIVVSDGCTDNTLELLNGLENRPEIVVLEKNAGKGKALKAGFKYASDAGFSYAVTLDADGQHYPEDIPLFLEANRRNPDALIVGSRLGLEKAERSKSSSFANKFSNFWFFIQTLCPLKDTQTGYRLYPLKRTGGLGVLTSRYEAELELLVFSAWKGVRIVSLDVNVFYPPRKERVSHFRPVYDFSRIFVLNLVLCLLALVYGLPRTILRKAYRILVTILTLSLYALSMILFITPGIFIFLKSGRITAEKKERLHGFICKLFRTALFKLGIPGVRYSQSNVHSEDFSKPAIIICNHQSHLDLLPMLALTPKMIVITADWVWKNPLYGYVIRNADFLPASDGIDEIAEKMKDLVREGYSIAIYPEGTRSADCSIGRFHQGAFYLADLLQIDILPLVLYGAGKALPKRGRVLNPWPVHLLIEERLTPEMMREKGDTFKERASNIRSFYKQRYGEISDYIERTQL